MTSSVKVDKANVSKAPIHNHFHFCDVKCAAAAITRLVYLVPRMQLRSGFRFLAANAMIMFSHFSISWREMTQKRAVLSGHVFSSSSRRRYSSPDHAIIHHAHDYAYDNVNKTMHMNYMYIHVRTYMHMHRRPTNKSAHQKRDVEVIEEVKEGAGAGVNDSPAHE